MSSTVSATWLDAHRVDPATLLAEPLVGAVHVAAEIRSLVTRLREPERAAALGAEVPRALLLHGPPGVGKTHAARHLATSLGPEIPLYEVGADELNGPLLRELFGALTHHRRSILVLDEIDLIGAERSESDAATRRTLAALLTCLDGLRPGGGVLAIGASNRSTFELDPALLRAGRLGYTIEIGLPDDAERAALLRHFLAARPLTVAPPYDELAERTAGWSPADLRAACADAAALALDGGRDAIEPADLDCALARAGRIRRAPVADPPLDRAALHRAAVHEAGHLVVASVLRGADWINAVELGERAGETELRAMGGATEDAVRDALAVAYGGIAAERLLLGAAIAGSADGDVVRATTLALELATGGLDPLAPPVAIGHPRIARTSLADRVAAAVGAALERARGEAALLVARHGELTARIAALLEAEAARGLEGLAPRPPAVSIELAPLRAVLDPALAGSNAGRSHPMAPRNGAIHHTGDARELAAREVLR